MTTCPNCHVKMLSNPIANGHPFWCPRCGQHEYVSSNGRQAVALAEIAKMARVGVAPSTVLLPLIREIAQEALADAAPPSECTCIDLPDGRQRTCPTCRAVARRAISIDDEHPGIEL